MMTQELQTTITLAVHIDCDTWKDHGADIQTAIEQLGMELFDQYEAQSDSLRFQVGVISGEEIMNTDCEILAQLKAARVSKGLQQELRPLFKSMYRGFTVFGDRAVDRGEPSYAEVMAQGEAA